MATTRKAASKVATSASGAQFKDIVEKLPFNPKTSDGSGFLPPFLRAMSHLLYCLGLADDELPKDKVEADKKSKEVENQLVEELKEALKHFNNIEISDNLSQVARDQLVLFQSALVAINSEFGAWDKDTKVNNLTGLINRAVGISAMLDRELIDLRTSDPGSNL